MSIRYLDPNVNIPSYRVLASELRRAISCKTLF